MKSQKQLSVFICVLFASVAISAQNTLTKNNEALVSIIVEKLNNDISLTEGQKESVKEQTRAYIVQMEAIDTSKSSDSIKMQQKKSAGQTYEMSINNIITSEQQTLLQGKIAERENN